MENMLTYRVQDSEAMACKEGTEVVFSKTSAANFDAIFQPRMAAHGKLLAMTVGSPTAMRVMNRKGNHSEATLTHRVRHLQAADLAPKDPCLFLATGDRAVSVLTPTTSATGTLTLPTATVAMPEEVFAAAPAPSGAFYVLGQQHVHHVASATAAPTRFVELAPKTVAKHPVLDFHAADNVLLVPSKNSHLDLVSVLTKKTVLTAPWEPHADTTPTYARFLQRRAFAHETSSVLLVTAARDNSVLRLWAYDEGKKKFGLRQELALRCDGGNESFVISVDSTEEYIILASRTSPHAVVVELDRDKLQVHRITTWATAGAANCAAAYVGKLQAGRTGAVEYALFLTVRTAENVVQCVLDNNKLAGAANVNGGGATGAGKSSAATGTGVSQWFPEEAAASTKVGAVPFSAVSSRGGDSKVNNSAAEAHAAATVTAQTQKFCGQLATIRDNLHDILSQVSSVTRMLRESQYRERAQEAGRDFAQRNQERLARSGGSGGSGGARGGLDYATEPGQMTESQRELILGLQQVVGQTEKTSEAAAEQLLRGILQQNLREAMARAVASMQLETHGATTMRDVGSSAAGQQFQTELNLATSNILTVLRESDAHLKDATSSDETERVLQQAKEYEARLQAAVAGARQDLADVNTALELLQSGGGNVPVDPEALVKMAIAKAEAGDWGGAVTVALEASDLSVLLQFLASPVCEEHADVLTNPSSLPLHVFLSLMLQLTHEMDSTPGEIPLRVRFCHLFYIEWDDHLRSIKAQAERDPNKAAVLQTIKEELHGVYLALEALKPAELDRKTRNNCRVLSRLMESLLS